MELRLISGRGKLTELAQDAVGRFSRIDDDESFQMFDRPRECGLLCSGMDLVSARYGFEPGVPRCCHVSPYSNVCSGPPFSAMVRLYF